jgi:hypothetical protein
MTETQKQRVWTRPFIILVAALACGAILFGVWLISRDSRESLTIAAIAESADASDGFASDALSGIKENTEDLCGGVDGCVEAAASAAVEIRRFDTKQAAASFSTEHPESFLSDWIVVVYTDPALPDSARQELEELIGSMWKSE